MTILTDEDRNLLQHVCNSLTPPNPLTPISETYTALQELINRSPIPTNPAYDSLEVVLKAAYNQAASGKGKERHAGNGLPFTNQPMQTISKLLNTSDGLAFQAIKKLLKPKVCKRLSRKSVNYWVRSTISQVSSFLKRVNLSDY